MNLSKLFIRLFSVRTLLDDLKDSYADLLLCDLYLNTEAEPQLYEVYMEKTAKRMNDEWEIMKLIIAEIQRRKLLNADELACIIDVNFDKMSKLEAHILDLLDVNRKV